jgi:type III pantothenate kinase
MVMVIDVGNSAVKVARVTQREVGLVTRLRTTDGPDGAAIRRLLEGPDAVALVSVVPAWSATIEDVVLAADRPLIVAAHDTIPLPVHLANPATVGADRLLAAWIARELVGAPCIVVDVGTATTIDVVDAAGAFAGGAILPGPALGVRSLARGTAMLPPVPLAPTTRAIGRNTLEAMAAGVMLGHAEAISGLIGRMTRELGGDRTPSVVLTGGDATVLDTPDWVDRTEPDLLLRGLGMLAEHVLAEQRVGLGA